MSRCAPLSSIRQLRSNRGRSKRRQSQDVTCPGGRSCSWCCQILGAPIRLCVFRVFVFRYGCKGPGLMWDKGNGCHVMYCRWLVSASSAAAFVGSSFHSMFSRSPIGGSGVAGHNPHSNRFYFSLCFSFCCSRFLNVFRVLFSSINNGGSTKTLPSQNFRLLTPTRRSKSPIAVFNLPRAMSHGFPCTADQAAAAYNR